MHLLSKKWIAALLVAIPLGSAAQSVFELQDPSGKMKVNVTIGDDITYSVSHEEDIIIGASPVSMTLTDGTVFGEKPRLKRKSNRSENHTI